MLSSEQKARSTVKFSFKSDHALLASLRATRHTVEPEVVRTRRAPHIDTGSRAPSDRHFPDNPAPSDHLRFLHGRAAGAPKEKLRHISLRRLSKDPNETPVRARRSVKIALPTLLTWADALTGEHNVFVTQSDFSWGANGQADRHRAIKKYVKSTGVVFVDLDCYNSRIFDELGGDFRALTQRILASCDAAGVSRPLVIHSGNGFYVYWALAERLDLTKTENIERWQALQSRLMSLLIEFGPDTKVKDLTRVLRLVGTVNDKTGIPVSVAYDDGARFDFDALESQVAHLQKLRPVASTEDVSQKKATKATRGARSRNDQPAVRGELKPEVLAWLESIIAADRPAALSLPKHRLRAWHMFCDMVQVVKLRGGLVSGERDEMQFWMMVMRFHAGMLQPEELESFASSLSHICHKPLDIFQEHMLSSLHARMVGQIAAQGRFASYRRQKRRVGAFVAVCSAPDFSRVHKDKQGFGEGFVRPQVYTPKAQTLIDKLCITPEEQQHLRVLVDAQEKARRRYADSATARKAERNAKAQQKARRTIARRANLDVGRLARELGVSTSTAYRITSSERAPRDMASIKMRVLSLLRAEPGRSMRSLASEVEVSASTVYRWVSAERQAQRVLEQARLATDLGSNIEGLGVSIPMSSGACSVELKSHIQPQFLSCLDSRNPLSSRAYESSSPPFSAVSLSHSCEHSIEGYSWREEARKQKEVAQYSCGSSLLKVVPHERSVNSIMDAQLIDSLSILESSRMTKFSFVRPRTASASAPKKFSFGPASKRMVVEDADPNAVAGTMIAATPAPIESGHEALATNALHDPFDATGNFRPFPCADRGASPAAADILDDNPFAGVSTSFMSDDAHWDTDVEGDMAHTQMVDAQYDAQPDGDVSLDQAGPSKGEYCEAEPDQYVPVTENGGDESATRGGAFDDCPLPVEFIDDYDEDDRGSEGDDVDPFGGLSMQAGNSCPSADESTGASEDDVMAQIEEMLSMSEDEARGLFLRNAGSLGITDRERVDLEILLDAAGAPKGTRSLQIQLVGSVRVRECAKMYYLFLDMKREQDLVESANVGSSLGRPRFA